MRKRIGTFLVESGAITEVQKQNILSYSEETGLRFGEAAMKLGVLTREKLLEIFGPSYKIDFFHLDTQYFPQQTHDWIEKDKILRFGALPLGMKRGYSLFRSKSVINLGLLNPLETTKDPEFKKYMNQVLKKHSAHDFKVFLVLADHFFDVLKAVYKIKESDLIQQGPEKIDKTLYSFVQEL